MGYTKTEFGTMKDGRTVYRYTLNNEHGILASFTDLGAIWLTMLVPDREGNMADVVLGYDTVETVLTGSGHMGEPVGRYANRIGGAKFTLNGKTYELAKNSSGKHSLHSGPDFYRNRVWETELEETQLGTSIHFSLFSPDGDQGYPGNANITVSYTLTADDSLKLDYHMVCDADTIANFTNHVYFNLAGHGSGSAMSQKVWMDADYYTVTDQDSITTGELATVKETPMDFTVMKPLSQDIEADFEPLKLGGGYDHNWCFNHPAGELTLCAKACDEVSGRMMEVYTDLPGVQLYTGNNLKATCVGKDGVSYKPRDGYCFETQNYPDAINKENFPSAVVKAGEEYKTTTIYKFYTV